MREEKVRNACLVIDMEQNYFIDMFIEVEDIIGNVIRELQKNGMKIVIFGTGYCLTLIMDLLIENDVAVECLCDNNSEKWGTNLYDYYIISPEDLLKRYDDDTSLVIATTYFDEITTQLENMGFKGNIYHLPKEAYSKNSVCGKQYLIRYLDKYKKVYEILADNISKKVFVNALKHNISIDRKYYEEIKEYEIDGYFGTDLYEASVDDIIIDCGAYNGDTIKEFLCQKTEFRYIYAFEPDSLNYEQLVKNFDSDKIRLIKKGVSDCSEMVYFNSGQGVSSKIDENGNCAIETVRLDECKFFGKITFIKMDIEGMEKRALLGAADIIKKQAPLLAISAYHKIEDMWELVEIIQELNPRYQIYFRHTFYYVEERIQPDIIIYAKVKG